MEKLAVYPVGLQGVALLGLRASVCVTTMCLLHALSPLAMIAMSALALALALGLMTRPAAVLWSLALAATGFMGLMGVFAATAQGLVGLALGLLGPGAYSVDARLFGRRVIRIGDPNGSRRAPPPPTPTE